MLVPPCILRVRELKTLEGGVQAFQSCWPKGVRRGSEGKKNPTKLPVLKAMLQLISPPMGGNADAQESWEPLSGKRTFPHSEPLLKHKVRMSPVAQWSKRPKLAPYLPHSSPILSGWPYHTMAVLPRCYDPPLPSMLPLVSSRIKWGKQQPPDQ